ncbi:hypothetical protein [Asticcacaulis sp. EMRT-3]|uniref:hypothetical protein n=1 Tax=Asticcacaulis sp. EMRT-3 TaxID=3040349 RepID=UPI0024AF1AC6|nr:hypothetical protein [Asticcacaulis sp. EMRT-3]MDI7776283.1 hypothetical protein [Asticcacaulis sp. EMRT-3]
MTAKTGFFDSFKAFARDPRQAAFLNYLLLFFIVLTFGLTGVLALLIANVAEEKAADWLKTHYQFQIRTFWFSIVPVILSAVIYTFVQKHHVANPTVGYVMMGLVLVCLGYTVGRAIMGFNHLLYGRPIPNPKAWLV